MILRRRKKTVAACPIKALCDQLKAEGWTVAVPFAIPNECFNSTCTHTVEDIWANTYAAKARQRVRDVENGTINFEDTLKEL